ncbi:MAG: glycosyltransferase family 4 protein [Saprospiraceae bacterium]
MKILFCTSFFAQTHNGAGQFANTVFRINELFPEHELHILSEDLDKKQVRCHPITIDYPRWLQGFGMLLRSFSYYRAAQELHQTHQFDLIFFNHAFTGIWSALRFSKPTKVVGFLHDDNLLTQNLQQFSFSKRWFIRATYRQVEKWAMRYLDANFVNTKYLQQVVQEVYSIHPKKLYQTYVPIDVQCIPFQSNRPIDLTQVIKVLFVKNDYPRGGLADLIVALGQLAYQFQLTVIGPFPSAHNEIQKWVAAQNNVQLNFLGNCTQARVFTALQTHHLLCIPAIKEAQGVTNIEGLAAGIPVVTTHVGGIPEIMNQGENGWLVAANAPKKLASTLKDCLENPAVRQQKSAAGRAFVLQHFDQQKTLATLLQKLQSL